jgi:hypothetical protein
VPVAPYGLVVPRPPLRRARPAAAFLAVLAVVLGMLSIASPAQAVDPFVRSSLPARAGTRLAFEGMQSGPRFVPDGTCTAGAVLRGTGLLSQVTPYQRAVRFILTAGHCAELGQKVRVGDVEIGTVTWVSGQSDLAIVRVEPISTRRRHCGPTSGAGIRCDIAVVYEPRAVGEVILVHNRVHQEASIPITGIGTPQPREIFCISGHVTGILCAFRSLGASASLPLQPHQVASESAGPMTTFGDSGAPVVSRGGTLFGIHAQGGAPGTPDAQLEAYVPIDQFFREQRGYALVTG